MDVLVITIGFIAWFGGIVSYINGDYTESTFAFLSGIFLVVMNLYIDSKRKA